MAYRITPFYDYAVTVSTVSAQVVGGTNVVFMLEQRPKTDITSAGTDIWTGDITAVEGGWIGGTSSDFTMPAEYALFVVITSVSGNVTAFEIMGEITRD